MKTLKIKSIDKEIKRLQKLIKKPSKHNNKRIAKIGLLRDKKELAKKYNKYARRKYLRNNEIEDFKQLKSKLAKTNKQLKKEFIKWFKGINNISDIMNSQEFENDRFIKGLKSALKEMGVINNTEFISVAELKTIQDMFDIKGLSFGDVVYIIEKYYSDDIEELFYNDDLARKQGLFNGEYFKAKLSEILDKVRQDVESEFAKIKKENELGIYNKVSPDISKYGYNNNDVKDLYGV